MIDPIIFEDNITLLMSHYSLTTGRQITLCAKVIAMWKRFLDANLTTETFEEAVEQCILTREWFPTANDLVKLAQEQEESNVYDQWLLVDAARKQYHVGLSSQQYQKFLAELELDTVSSHVVEVMGGYRTLSEMSSQDLSFRRDEFVKLYKLYKPRELELELAFEEKAEAKLLKQQSVAAALPPSTTAPVEMPVQLQQKMTELAQTKSFAPVPVSVEEDPVEKERKRLEAMKRNKELARLFLEQSQLSKQTTEEEVKNEGAIPSAVCEVTIA